MKSITHLTVRLVGVLGILAVSRAAAGEATHKVAAINFGTPDAKVDKSDGTWDVPVGAVPYAAVPQDSPARSMAFGGKTVEFSIGGLRKDARYFLELTYLSDAPGRMQAVLVNGNLVRERFSLPSREILTQRIELTKSDSQKGEIHVTIENRLGANAIVSAASLFSDNPSLEKRVVSQFYGTRDHITGAITDLNAAENNAVSGVTVTAALGDKKLTGVSGKGGEFSIKLPADWTAVGSQQITLSTNAGTAPLSFQASVLTGDLLRREILDNSCHDPFELAIAKDGRIFYIERLGALKQVIPETKSSRTIATIPVYSKLDDGLLGLVLDPGFDKNGWLYLCYSDPANPQNLVSRFTIKDGNLVAGSEKVLLKIPTRRDAPPCHTGGSLAFDSQGNLFISTGDYTNPFDSQGYAPTDERQGRALWDAQGSSGDTSSLMGKILRITPRPDGSYGIPKGNLFANGADPVVARPEIYVMGCRNPFRISVDQKTSTLYWGEVGPDSNSPNPKRGPAGHDEFNQAKKAGNYGWPYFVGDNIPYTLYNFVKESDELRNAEAPKNTSPNNKGLKTLPPAQPALIYYPYSPTGKFPLVGAGGRCAMGGPVYRKSPTDSSTALGEKYDNTVFAYDWSRNWIIACKLDENENMTSMERFMPDVDFKKPMDLELAHDGTLYLIEWGSNYGGSNPDARISRLVPGADLNAVGTKAVPQENQEEAMRNKFASALEGGDVAMGKELFKSPKGGCIYCHKSDEDGGIIGPSLEAISSKLTRKEILESILFPSERIDPPYLTVAVTDMDGKATYGSVVSEDAHHLVIKGGDGSELKMDKAALKEIKRSPSPMSAGAGESLSPTEMQNLVGYLETLGKK